MPPLAGAPIRIETSRGLRDRYGPVNAGAFLRERRIAFDCTRSEFPRIFAHELFHFVWLRAGNARRWSYENLLMGERRAGVRGELGWSAEWRKRDLPEREIRSRGRVWREYCCESFCDTAAWLYGGLDRHLEFTLPETCRAKRKNWFRETWENCSLQL